VIGSELGRDLLAAEIPRHEDLLNCVPVADTRVDMSTAIDGNAHSNLR
jgi:hypothetical protein